MFCKRQGSIIKKKEKKERKKNHKCLQGIADLVAFGT
jgi:hypothetical protein